MAIKSLDELVQSVLKRASSQALPKVAIARSGEQHVLQAGVTAYTRGIAEPVLIGDIEKTCQIAETLQLDIAPFEKISVPDDQSAVFEAVRLFRHKKVQFIMKGLVATAYLLKGVLHKQTGVPNPGRILSHVSLFESPIDGRLMCITDPAVNIAPTMQRKVEILRNALDVVRKLGVKQPKVAVLAATEKINYPAMPATLDADILTKMARQGAFGDVMVLGPISLDLAISAEAATAKKFENPVAGNADILLVPNIEAGNILYKSLTLFSRCPMAAVVVGSQVPVVLPSRGDSEASKFYSIALASFLAQRSEL